MSRFVGTLLALLTLSGCTSYGVIENQPSSAAPSTQPYSIRTLAGRDRDSNLTLVLAFSGGGTRAAALAYGVLQELRDTTITVDGQPRRLLDEVDAISSVSGGSFASAYYGLYGERIFEDFEDAFLRRDVQDTLIGSVLNPFTWFDTSGRTEIAVKYYEDEIFGDATFADMRRKDGPMVLINASDLSYGVRFSFVQEYFNLLCSDISSFPVARAVTASSAVPVIFNPVVVENYEECKHATPEWITQARQRSAKNPQLTSLVDGLEGYFQTKNRQYTHFVDGGITDNLGLRAIYEIIELSGGSETFFKKVGELPPRNFVVISVDASTVVKRDMDQSNKQPSIPDTISAMTDAQLHLYNTATLALMSESLDRWTETLSTPERPVKPHFIQLAFDDIAQRKRIAFFNRIPTSFKLSDEQVDSLIAAGRELLRTNPEFQSLLADLQNDSHQTM